MKLSINYTNILRKIHAKSRKIMQITHRLLTDYAQITQTHKLRKQNYAKACSGNLLRNYEKMASTQITHDKKIYAKTAQKLLNVLSKALFYENYTKISKSLKLHIPHFADG